MNGTRTALLVIGAEIAVAASFLFSGAVTGLHGTAQAEMSPKGDIVPSCDQPDVTLCQWSVDVDGQLIDVKGCAYEDGNPDGLPCLWFDPGTGRAFFNDGSNYRN